MGRSKLFCVIGNSLSLAVAATGALMLALAAAAVLEGWFWQWSGRLELNRVQASSRRSLQVVRPERGQLLARLQIPRLNMSVVVLEGSDDRVLKRGPGHIEETALPGELGNVAIAGHRDTHFRPLRDIRVNDEVVLTTRTTTIRYFIDTVNITHPIDMQILDPTSGPTLTLVTCYPFEWVGNAPMRFVIRATPRTGGATGDSSYAHR